MEGNAIGKIAIDAFEFSSILLWIRGFLAASFVVHTKYISTIESFICREKLKNNYSYGLRLLS